MTYVTDLELSEAVDRSQENFRGYVAKEFAKLKGWGAAAADYVSDPAAMAAMGTLSVTLWAAFAVLTFLVVATTFWWNDWVSCDKMSSRIASNCRLFYFAVSV